MGNLCGFCPFRSGDGVEPRVSFGFLSDLNLGIWPFVGVALCLAGLERLDGPGCLNRLRVHLPTRQGVWATSLIATLGASDFIDFHVAGWHFWAFNLADTWISLGAVILVLDSVYRCRS